MPFTKDGKTIDSLADWEVLGKPKSSDQWVPDRSAMETARSWLHDGGRTIPSVVKDIFKDHPDFGPILNWHGEPEVQLRFDEFPGEPRNTDVLVVAQDKFGSYVLAVEGKADEPFSSTVADTLAAAAKRKIENPRSNGITRVQQLGMALFGVSDINEPAISELRYQLFTATAGALCEAERRGLDRAVLLVHEFITRKTNDEKHRANAADLNRFLHKLSNGAVRESGAQLVGPFLVPGPPLLQKPPRLYLGKVVENLRS